MLKKILLSAISLSLVILSIGNGYTTSVQNFCPVDPWNGMNHYSDTIDKNIKDYLDSKLSILYTKIENNESNTLQQGIYYKKVITKISQLQSNNTISDSTKKSVLGYIKERLTHKVKRIIADEQCKIDSENSSKKQPIRLEMELGKYYIVTSQHSKTIISLDSFSQNGYMNFDLAPTMDIYGNYENNDYFRVLGTFVLPESVSPNTEANGYRENIESIPFSFKLISWDNISSMKLDILPKGNTEIEIKEIQLQNETINLYERKTLPAGVSTVNIYETLRNKVKLSSQ